MLLMNKLAAPLAGITLAGMVALLTTSALADTFGSGANTFTIGFVPIANAGNATDSATASIQRPMPNLHRRTPLPHLSTLN